MSKQDELERTRRLGLWNERDRAQDGRFLAGVVTTGIYCLPSCPARRPKDENVRFFEDEAAARGAGLRACKRCRPDRFLKGYDPEIALAETLRGRVAADPAGFASTAALARALGVGATKINELVRRQFHTTPRAYLHRARLRAAAQALLEGRKLLDAALDHGFESSSAFHEGFRARMAMSPAAYARLGSSNEFELTPAPGRRFEDAFRIFGRDMDGRTERVAGDTATKAVVLGGRPLLLELRLGAQRIRARVLGTSRQGRARLVAAHAIALRCLGMELDPGPFERMVRRSKGLGRLVRGRAGLTIPQTSDAFEGLVWVVVGQQVNVSFASVCRARLIELAGRPVGATGMIAHPDPASVGALEYAELERLQFSRRKAEYVIDTARRIAEGDLELEALREAPVGSLQRTLGAVRGLGPWSVNYLAMRSFGREDCVPVGDVALEQALQNFFGTNERPDAKGTVQLMEPFAPHRSLATFHLWRSLSDPGEVQP